MSFWGVMNWVAWGLCGVIIILLGKDFIDVELELAGRKKKIGRKGAESSVKVGMVGGTDGQIDCTGRQD
jgi:hypothetical protein